MKVRKVLVFGAGLSGIAATRLLRKNGNEVILYDGNKYLNPDNIRNRAGGDDGVRIVLGDLDDEVLDKVTLSVLSPGISLDSPEVLKIARKNIPIWGEIELAYVYGKGDVLAITGTNGKTTTTALLGEIMKKYTGSVFVVGNIGTPYTAMAGRMRDDSVTVAEISSFQLETIHTFRPRVSAVLNITPDHLNRHHTMEEYIAAKKRIAQNQTEDDTIVLNYEDDILRGWEGTLKPKILYFSSKRKPERGVFLDNGEIIIRNPAPETVCRTDELKLPGTHNYENVMAAVAMAASYGVPLEIIREAVTGFEGVPHRIEFVCEKDGVAYYNDSKGTNPDAAIRGIRAMRRKTILIGGGYDKNAEYEEWIRSFDGKVRYLVLIGATKEKIAATAKKEGFNDVIMADTLEEAVGISKKLAEKGDAVLLSPACASWDMFKSYEERGEKFKELVRKE